VDWGELEYLVVDSPPGTSDEHITLAKLMKGSEGVSAIIVTTPQEIALLDVRKVGSGLGFGDEGFGLSGASSLLLSSLPPSPPLFLS
jgi:hypothetical protein